MGASSGIGSVSTPRTTSNSSSSISVGKRTSDFNSSSRSFLTHHDTKRLGVFLSEQAMDGALGTETTGETHYPRNFSTVPYFPESDLSCEYQTECITMEEAIHLGQQQQQYNRNDSSVPVYVMLPLDTVNENGVFKYSKSIWFHDALRVLVLSGVKGVAVDVWWGVVERRPRRYIWDGYQALFDLIKSTGLNMQLVLSFHACGGNVGDVVQIPLPEWVLECGESDPDIFLCDRPRHHHGGQRNRECLSIFADEVPGILYGRSPMECYNDFMAAFRDEFESDLGSFITDIVIGAGPCGELRYPSYSEPSGWRFPGIGEFQCYDRHALSSLAKAAMEAGHSEWGYGGPHNSGTYNNWPQDASFFNTNTGTWDSNYGTFFLQWYSDSLLQHGKRLMTTANSVFKLKLKQKSTIAKSTESIMNGMKMWLTKTSSRLCRSPSTASGTDNWLSENSATVSGRSASISSVLYDPYQDSIMLKDTTATSVFSTADTSLDVCLKSTVDGDYDLLEVGKGVYAPVRFSGVESSTCSISDGSLEQQDPTTTSATAGMKADLKTGSVLAKKWDAGDFLRRIVNFLHYESQEQTSSKLQLSLKIAGIHWWYRTRSHAAELTAGYYNTDDRCGYEPIINLCRDFNFNLILTCVEMCDEQHPREICSSPQGLLRQIRRAAASAGVYLSGENALPVFYPGQGGVDVMGLERIVEHCRGKKLRSQEQSAKIGNSISTKKSLQLPRMHSFTFLRLVPEITKPNHQGLWMRFMHGMQDTLYYS